MKKISLFPERNPKLCDVFAEFIRIFASEPKTFPIMVSKTYYRYIWLLDIILNSDPLTYGEIAMRWESFHPGSDKLSSRTFHEHRKGVKEMFGVDIKCDKSHGYVYYVENPEVLNESKPIKWLLREFSIPKDFATFHRMRDRILLEEIPNGTAYLTPITDAMLKNVELVIDYQKHEGTNEELHVQPYALKVYDRKWYLLGYVRERSALRTLALDSRMINIQTTDKPFAMPKDFDADKYFQNTIGVFVSEDIPISKVRIRAYGDQVEYLRSLPLHKSQKEVSAKRNDSEWYSEFEYRLCITPELISRLLSMEDSVEVLLPIELRNEIRKRLEATLNRYTEEK